MMTMLGKTSFAELLSEEEARFISNPYWDSLKTVLLKEHWRLFSRDMAVNIKGRALKETGSESIWLCTDEISDIFRESKHKYKQLLVSTGRYARSFEISQEEAQGCIAWFDKYGLEIKNVLDGFYGVPWRLITVRLFAAMSAPSLELDKLPSSHYWHRDSVGHSIKLWVPILLQGSGVPHTSLIKGTHTTPPIPQMWEMYRAEKDVKRMTMLTSRINSKLCESVNVFTNRELVLAPGYGKSPVFLFDTNTIHRGNYANADEGFRLVLELQFNSDFFANIFT